MLRWGAGLLLLLLGASLLGWGLTRPHPKSAAPLPSHEFVVAPGSTPTTKAASHQVLAGGSCADSAGSWHVVIPSLCINAPMTQTGSSGGSVVIPTAVSEVAWYNQSAGFSSPSGNTVIVGHVDSYSQGPGALSRLSRIQPGAVVIARGDGGQGRWLVTSLRVYPKAALPQDIFTTTGARQLVLVTCGGPIEHIDGIATYADNVVVTAVPV